MLSKILGFVSNYPEIGISGGVIGAISTDTSFLQFIGAILAILIAAITLGIKVIDLISKFRKINNQGNKNKEPDIEESVDDEDDD